MDRMLLEGHQMFQIWMNWIFMSIIESSVLKKENLIKYPKLTKMFKMLIMNEKASPKIKKAEDLTNVLEI